ncbi:15585_t:CDS:1, partial [Acaulospora morrowiae]
GIAVSNAMNAAAGSFPSPSPTNSPNNSAFSGWNHKRVKYEFSEATTPSSSQSSPRNSTPGGYQLPGLGAGPGTPGANPSTPAYTSSNLQMVTNASSPHHYSSATSNGGTPTPTHEGLDRYIEHGAVLHTSSPENVGNAEESRRYEQYRQREDPPATEDIN